LTEEGRVSCTMAWADSPKSIKVPATPSMLRNNLDSSENSPLAYCFASTVFVLNSDEKTRPVTIDIPGSNLVIQTKWVKTSSGKYLAIATTKEIILWDYRRGKMSCKYALANEKSAGPADFFRGIAGVDGKVCVGCSTGIILVLEDSHGSLNLVTRLTASERAASSISAMFGERDMLLSGDSNGNITVWNGSSLTEETAFVARGSRSPCMSVVGRGQIVIGGFASGHIRIFSRMSESIVAEITAHARCITGLALHPTKNIYASAGEDAVVNVFAIPQFESKTDGDIELLFSKCVKDALFTGIAFDSQSIVASIYDRSEMVVFSQKARSSGK